VAVKASIGFVFCFVVFVLFFFCFCGGKYNNRETMLAEKEEICKRNQDERIERNGQVPYTVSCTSTKRCLDNSMLTYITLCK
jgi:hypothetical protein